MAVLARTDGGTIVKKKKKKEAETENQTGSQRGESRQETASKTDESSQKSGSAKTAASPSSANESGSNRRGSSGAFGSNSRGSSGSFGSASRGFGSGTIREDSERAEKARETPASGQSAAGTVLDVIGRGAGQFDYAVASTADFLANLVPRVEGALIGEEAEGTFTGQLLKPVTEATGAFKDQIADMTGRVDQRIQEATQDSKAAKWFADLGSSLVSAAPNAALAMMTAGGSAATQLGVQGADWMGVCSTVLKKAAQDPRQWMNLVQTLSSSYDQAAANGATESEALAAATLTTILNATMNAGGGIEKLPGVLGASVSEAGEGQLRGLLERLIAKATYDHDKPYFSVTDENAVFNPKVVLRDGTEDIAFGIMTNGSEALANEILQGNWGDESQQPANGSDADSSLTAEEMELNQLNHAVTGENIRYNGMEQEVLEAALNMPPESEARKQAEQCLEQAQAKWLEQMDAVETQLKLPPGNIENEDQLQALASAVSQLDEEMEALGEKTLADFLTSEQLGQLSETLQEEMEELTNKQTNNIIEEAPLLNKKERCLQKQLDYVWNGEKLFIPEGAEFEYVKTIAGNGVDVPIRVINRLVSQHGGNSASWKKQVGCIESNQYVFDVHWYELNGIQYDVKLKYRRYRKEK